MKDNTIYIDSKDSGIKIKGYKILRFLSVLFLPEKYSYKSSRFTIEGIPIGWIIVTIALIVKFI